MDMTPALDAIDPTMEIVARGARAKRLLMHIVQASRDLNTLLNEIEDDARRTLALLDAPGEPSSARDIATRIVNPAIDTLTDADRGDEHGAARGELHRLYAAHGEALMEPRYLYHIGVRRGLTLRHEYDLWLSRSKRRAA